MKSQRIEAFKNGKIIAFEKEYKVITNGKFICKYNAKICAGSYNNIYFIDAKYSKYYPDYYIEYKNLNEIIKAIRKLEDLRTWGIVGYIKLENMGTEQQKIIYDYNGNYNQDSDDEW